MEKRLKNLNIITGCSKGIGKAILEKSCSIDNTFTIGVSRSKIDLKNPSFLHIETDLCETSKCLKIMEELKNWVLTHSYESVVLLNNAGRLGPIKKGWEGNPDEITKTFFLNLTAPVLLQNALLGLATENRKIEIVNISSGAAKNPYHGWQAYCSSKAGLDMQTRVTALEIENAVLNAKVWNLLPGVVDTQMQSNIRSANENDFVTVDRFIQLKKENKLTQPEVVAQFILKAIRSDKFKNGGIYDIRDFK